MRILTFLLIALVSTAEVRLKNSNRLFCDDSVLHQSTLLSGCVWIRSEKVEKINTLHAEVTSRQADFLVHVVDRKIFYYNHRGILSLSLRDGRSLLIPQGFFVWISEISSDRKNQTGVISPIEKSHIEQLARLWQDDPKILKAELDVYKKIWQARVQAAAETYKGRVSRKIASIESLKQRKLDQQREASRERSRQQKILFDRVFNR